MNASFAKNQIAHSVSAGPGYSSSMEAVARAEGDARRVAGRGLGRKIADALAYLVALPRRRAVLDELSLLTDRELADIGIARSELKRVFEPALARDRVGRADSYRSLGINV